MISRSRKPCVTSRASLAPLRSISVLTAIVVPWTKYPMLAGSMPCSAASACSPSSSPRTGSAGTVGDLKPATLPVLVSVMVKSVNVPPMSAPMR